MSNEKRDVWDEAMTKLFWVGLQGDGPENDGIRKIKILMEVVSAEGLDFTKFKGDIDPSCLVKLGQNKVHRTDSIWNDPDPIWTVKTKSLCLLNIPSNWEDSFHETNQIVTAEVCHGNLSIGKVRVPISEVLQMNGERQEYDIVVNPDHQELDSSKAKLVLRFRPATKQDLEFFEAELKRDTTIKNSERAKDINFKNIVKEEFSNTKRSKDKGGNDVTLHRAQPYPDPDRPETEWFRWDDLHAEALKPSKKWMEVGYGNFGRVYVELIGCNDLIDMDMGSHDLTDSYVAMVFEDTMVRSEICFNNLNPRWMPWSSRAFCFHIWHPSSLLFLGVFDYDRMKNHDPIGRVCINTAKFRSGVNYLLHYPLQHMPNDSSDRGNIILRLRVEWNNEREAVVQTFSSVPPRFLINVDNDNSLKVLRYTCRGPIDMDDPNMETVKLWFYEFLSYGTVYCYIIDVIFNIWLWRGRAKVLGFDVWFPIHSVFVFVATTVALERPRYIPALVFYSLAWILLTMNYHLSRHPNPWQRCKSMGELNRTLLFGHSRTKPIKIEPFEGAQEAAKLEQLDSLKAQRISAGFWETIRTGLKFRRMYKKANINYYSIESKEVQRWNFLGGYLYYVHLLFYYLVTYWNTFRHFFNWRGYYAHSSTVDYLLIGTTLFFLPMDFILLWVGRVMIWLFLSPLMKFADIFYFHKFYRTKEELLADPVLNATGFDGFLEKQSKKYEKDTRIAAEDAIKLKDMRERMFGKLCWQVPTIDTSRKPSVPLPESSAEPYVGYAGDEKEGFIDLADDCKVWTYIPGQKLEGRMIHHHLKNVAELDHPQSVRRAKQVGEKKKKKTDL